MSASSWLALAHRLGRVGLGEVEALGVEVRQAPQRLDVRLHRQQHPAHVGVVDDRRVARRARRPALAALGGVGHRLLVRPLAERQPLQPDRQAGRVHHLEHVAHALVGLADEVADGVVVGHHARRAGVDAHLVLDRHALDGVALAERAVVVDEELRHDEAGDALACRGARRAPGPARGGRCCRPGRARRR